ncbi:hypothetical protein SISNIDRAFT_187218 [Sistotremastrum niveocremeum HHB9708]|uniref:Ras modification protein ERF4 n=1 Tax=Sistotremastrum niveocremeum HHB9708 TaxID=1314777 RepID=A0A164R970_9AGAM|nr:hypothetical protein SISNIDRAFT_187218 [Sistotremastrum niveocremeum HHB9708]
MDTDVDVDGMKMRERPVEHPLKFEVTGTRTPPRPINTPLPASEHEGPGRTDSFDQRKDKKEALPMSQPQPPRSSYYYGPPADDSAFGTEPMGTIGTHYPREIIRVERDYESGELCQFATAYPLELEGRITPTEFLESINAINEILISAHSTLAAFVDNTVAVLTLYISNLFWTTQYDRSMKRLAGLIDELNAQTFNPRGLNILWPRRVAFLFLEIEYY